MRRIASLLAVLTVLPFLLAAAPESRVVTVPQDRYAAERLIPVEVNGHEFLFLMDTGAEVDVYDPRLAQWMGPVLATDERVNSHTGATTTVVRRPPAANIAGRLPVSSAPCIVLDLDWLREATGRDVVGILGMTTLARYAWRLDPDASQVQIADNPAAFDTSEMRVTDIIAIDPLPKIVLALDDYRFVSAVIDSGYSGFVGFSAQQATKATAAGLIKPSDRSIPLAAAAGEGAVGQARVDQFRVAGFRLGRSIIDTKTRHDVVGMELLRRFVVVLDFNARVVHLKPSRQFRDVRRDGGSGVIAKAREGRCIVAGTYADGFYDVSALQAGDEIVAANDVIAGDLTLARLTYELSDQPRKPERLTIRRDGAIIRLVLKPKSRP